jgi:Skp family chaperone for outer membrane proteins
MTRALLVAVMLAACGAKHASAPIANTAPVVDAAPPDGPCTALAPLVDAFTSCDKILDAERKDVRERYQAIQRSIEAKRPSAGLDATCEDLSDMVRSKLEDAGCAIR